MIQLIFAQVNSCLNKELTKRASQTSFPNETSKTY